MDIIHCLYRLFCNTDIESSLPQPRNSKIEGKSRFICIHNVRNCFRCLHIHEKMTMVRHNHKCVEKECMQIFHSIECFDGFASVRRIGKEGNSVFCIGCHHECPIVLNGVPLCHVPTIDLFFA